jgi:hypothetical protein
MILATHWQRVQGRKHSHLNGFDARQGSARFCTLARDTVIFPSGLAPMRMQPSDPLGILIAEGRLDTVVTALKRAYGCPASMISMSAYWLHAD